VEHKVRIGSGKSAVEALLILARKPEDATLRQQQKVQRRASRKGCKTHPHTLRTAGFMMLVTSLPEARASAEQVVALYRMRWQIELAFKRLKSLSRFDELRAEEPKLARAWLLAHLIAAVLIETSLGEDLDSPP
jgi:IS4 transposase